MIIHYLKSGLGNLLSQKLFTGINITGLAIALSCALAIVAFIRFEFSFDEHYRHAEQIVRISQRTGGEENIRVPGALAAVLRENVGGVRAVARFVSQEVSLSAGELSFNESHFAFADSEFLELFDFQWLKGSAAEALGNPSGVVLTRSMAARYFGEADPMGRVLLTADGKTLQVTGLIADLPAETHFRFSGLASMRLFESQLRDVDIALDSWDMWFATTYVLLDAGMTPEAFADLLPSLAAQFAGPGFEFLSLPLTDIYFRAQSGFEGTPSGNFTLILASATVAVGILFIAVVNFITLSTARTSWRAVEVGLRRTVGGLRRDIVYQFLLETFIVVLAATLLSLVLLELLLPLVNAVTEKNLSFDIGSDWTLAAGVVVFALALTGIAGSYPAWFLSGYRPAAVLKGGIFRKGSAFSLSGFLVVLQFSVSVIMIAVSAVIFFQLSYSEQVERGFSGGNVVVMQLPGSSDFDVNSRWPAFRQELNLHPGIVAASHSRNTPLLQDNYYTASVYPDGNAAVLPGLAPFIIQPVSPSYAEVYQLELLAGRWLSESLQSDRVAFAAPGYNGPVKGAVVLNEQAARQLGLTADSAPGRIVSIGTTSLATVVGVVRDTVVSARDFAAAQVFYSPETFDYTFDSKISIRLDGSRPQDSLDYLRDVWRRFAPGEPVHTYFMDEQLQAMYRSEKQQMQLAILSALLAVLIACSGLYGLAAFNAERRRREVGIRKAVGGSVWSIVLLLTNDFSKLVLLSNVIAWPVAYTLMQRWLESFAYRIDLTPLVFIGSGLVTLCIAWVTVGGIAARAASRKPVLALRYE